MPSTTYPSLEEGKSGKAARAAYQWLSLRKGSPLPVSQVILLKNLDSDRGLVNGARGIVTGFIPNPSYDERSAAAGPKAFPMVQFTSPGMARPCSSIALPVPIINALIDGNPFEMKLGLEEWTVEQGGETLAVFRQLPLKLAWALSIHKSQVRPAPRSTSCAGLS